MSENCSNCREMVDVRKKKQKKQFFFLMYKIIFNASFFFFLQYIEKLEVVAKEKTGEISKMKLKFKKVMNDMNSKLKKNEEMNTEIIRSNVRLQKTVNESQTLISNMLSEKKGKNKEGMEMVKIKAENELLKKILDERLPKRKPLREIKITGKENVPPNKVKPKNVEHKSKEKEYVDGFNRGKKDDTPPQDSDARESSSGASQERSLRDEMHFYYDSPYFEDHHRYARGLIDSDHKKKHPHFGEEDNSFDGDDEQDSQDDRIIVHATNAPFPLPVRPKLKHSGSLRESASKGKKQSDQKTPIEKNPKKNRIIGSISSKFSPCTPKDQPLQDPSPSKSKRNSILGNLGSPFKRLKVPSSKKNK